MRDLAIVCSSVCYTEMLEEWRWIVPNDYSPLLVGAFGDWIIGAPDGPLWSLELLEGSFLKVADNHSIFNAEKSKSTNLNHWFMADWVGIAAQHGLVPTPNECLGWKIHPILGGSLSIDNIQVFSLRVYQALMGQLFRQLNQPD